MTRKALITGATGLLGRQVLRAFASRSGWTAVGTGLSRAKSPDIIKLDLLDTDQIGRVLDDVRPDVVIHCAATRSPNLVIHSPSQAHALNVSAPTHIAQLTSARSILLIYISTDYVFPGRPGEAPYATDAPPAPPNLYGETKRAGEVGVLRANRVGGFDGGDGDASVAKDDSKGTLPDGYKPREKGGLAQTVPAAVVLRVPVLYGAGPRDEQGEAVADESEEQKGAVNSLVDRVWEAAQRAEEVWKRKKAAEEKGEKADEGKATTKDKIKMDDWAIRYPTNTEDVGRVIADISTLYLETAATPTRSQGPLPQILHFSSEDRYTKYQICQVLAEILGLAIEDGMEAHDPTAGESKAGGDGKEGDKEKGGGSQRTDAVVRPYDCHLDTSTLRELGISVSTMDFVGWWRRELRAFRR